MSPPGKKSNSEGSLDRISDLEDNLKVEILQRLLLTDAIKTSELSRNWRRIWTGLKFLKFENIGSLTEARFTRIIERILLLHQDSLRQFSVVIPVNFDASRLHLYGWFISLLRKRVQAVQIIYGRTGGAYLHIPTYFFDCGGLECLSLEHCALRPPPSFQGFHCLVLLELCCIQTTSKELAEFISRCPNLDELSLTDMSEWIYEPLIISAPNISILHFEDHITGMIILKDTPCLTVVTLECFENMHVLHRNSDSMFRLLCSLSTIEELTFDLPLLEPFNSGCPNNLEREFVALKTLNLGQINICNRDDILFTFCLLRSAPNLKMLEISVKHIEHDNEEDEVFVECLEAERRQGYILGQLLDVKIAGITGLRSEIMLVNTMLSSCPLLKTLRIEPSLNIKIERELKMAWELNGCSRISKDVKLVYSGPLVPKLRYEVSPNAIHLRASCTSEKKFFLDMFLGNALLTFSS